MWPHVGISDVPLHYYFPEGVKNSVAVQCKEMSLEILAFLSVSYTPLTLFMCSTPPAQRFFLYYNQLLPCKENITLQSMITMKFSQLMFLVRHMRTGSTTTQSKSSACTWIVEAEQLQDDEPSKSTFFNSSSQLLRNVLICLCPDWSFQDRVEKSRAGAWFFTRVKRGPYLDGAC